MKMIRAKHQRTIVLAFAVALLALPTALLACGNPDLTGAWAGTLVTEEDGPAQIAFDLTEADGNLTGTFTHESGVSGDLTGKTTGYSVKVTLLGAAGEPGCDVDLEGILDGEDKITGTFLFCDEPTPSTFDIFRQ